MVIPSLEVLEAISQNFVENINHQKDAQRNSIQKDVLNSTPSFFQSFVVNKTLFADALILIIVFTTHRGARA